MTRNQQVSQSGVLGGMDDSGVININRNRGKKLDWGVCVSMCKHMFGFLSFGFSGEERR